MRKNFRLTLISFLLVILYISNCQAANLDTKLITEYNYSHFDSHPHLSNTLANSSSIEFNIFGLHKQMEYQLEFNGQAHKQQGQLTQANLSKMIGRTVLEIGKQKWAWGKGFSYSPTYTLDEQESYWGLGTNTIFNNSTLSYGLVLDNTDQEIYSSWLRYNHLLATSDYSLILSHLQPETAQENINLGLNYSKDFLNGLTVNASSNLQYEEQSEELYSQNLLGLEYITKKNKMLILEYYHQENNHLTLVINNHSSTFNPVHWQIKETINLDDYGQLRALNLSYTAIENITPELNISNFAGAKDSKLEQNPKDWTISLKLTINI